MGEFLKFLNEHSGGIIVLFGSVFAFGILVNYLMWMFGLGRYKPTDGAPKRDKLNFVVADAAIKLINDFRHLLALFLVLVFSSVLVYVIYRANGSMTEIKDALQSVMATLGGLIGSIIGYYFGESAGRSSTNSSPTAPLPIVTPNIPPVVTPPIQGTTTVNPITPVPPPE